MPTAKFCIVLNCNKIKGDVSSSKKAVKEMMSILYDFFIPLGFNLHKIRKLFGIHKELKIRIFD